MTARRPEYTRPFSTEYQQATGMLVTRMMDGPFHEYVDASYVAWVEQELTGARAKLGGPGGT